MKILEIRFEDNCYIEIERSRLNGDRALTNSIPTWWGVDRLCQDVAENCSIWTRECLKNRKEKTYKITEDTLNKFLHKLIESGDFAAPYAISKIRRLCKENEDKGQENEHI